jgi:DNA-binding response OmpR family regulator
MKPHILIVEDNFFLAEELSDIVQHDLHAVAMTTGMASTAINLIPDDFELAFLDIEVLDGNTYPVARLLRASNIPFIFVSGNDPKSLPEEFRNEPFIGKPYRKSEIIRLARSLTDVLH